MKVELKGKKIKLVNSAEYDINRIIEIELSNSEFVNHYSKNKHLELLSDEDCIHLSIRRLDNNILVGHMILFGATNADSGLEFRRLAVSEKGQGFGREAVSLLKTLCFEKMKFHRLWLDCYSDNERAIHVYESEGFIFEGELRDKFKIKNEYRSQRIYSMLEDEYKSYEQK